MSKKLYLIILLAVYFSTNQSFAQEKEIYPPYNIKTVTFVQNNQNTIPVFRMNDSFHIDNELLDFMAIAMVQIARLYGFPVVGLELFYQYSRNNGLPDIRAYPCHKDWFVNHY